MQEDKLKIVIVGHVDHGKSTLIGRLLFDTDSLPLGKAENIQKACEAEGMEFEYAFLLDALLEEQAQNITIDTTQIQFKSAKRPYVIIDAPGHREFLKNMITGAASADAAVLLIDANEGVQEQSRRHGYLLSMLGIRQVIVAANKMDLVGYSQETFDRIRSEYTEYLKPLGITPRHFVPISAKLGENIAVPTAKMPWYHGPCILQALDGFDMPVRDEKQPLRFLVQDIYRFDERRILAGRIESGSLSVGDELVFWPDRKRSTVKSIELWNSDPAPLSANAGQSTAITLTDQIFVERGQIASHDKECPAEAREFVANIFWLHDEPLRLDAAHELKLGTQSVEARVVKFHRILDSSTLQVATEPRLELRKNEAAEVLVRTRRPIAFDAAETLPVTGRFVLMQGKRIGGGGIVLDAAIGKNAQQEVKSGNITWTVGRVSREDRSALLGHKGAVIWMSGLSGAGKSTLAVATESALHSRGMASFILDGDNLRHGLCSDLGFSPKDRAENIRRAGEVAKLMAESGMIVLTSLISPYEQERERVRQSCAAAGVPFAMVYINAPLGACEDRDPRGLYKKARAGEIKGFTGIDSPYEPPAKPELELRTDQKEIIVCRDELLALIVELTRRTGQYRSEESDPGAAI